MVVQRTGAAYKEQSGVLSAATMDRASNALTYRIFGREQDRQHAYERELESYENAAVKANIWSSSLPPIYKVISMAADACKLLSILAVVWSCNRGLAYVLLALLPLLFVFTRSVQKRMLAAQLANRKAVGRASATCRRPSATSALSIPLARRAIWSSGMTGPSARATGPL